MHAPSADLDRLDLDALLGRPMRAPLSAEAVGSVRGRRVLVTGAAGSIGSELVRQVHALGAASVVMVDQDECGLHALQLSLSGQGLLTDDTIVLADIRDAGNLTDVIGKAAPDVVFHAAAVKHLPLLERFPVQAFRTNVLGTLNVARACRQLGVAQLVNISTDKAAKPTSVLGLSKRLAEYVVRSIASPCTGVASVRFGNVLGSRGSFLPTLQWQLARRQELTITHPDVTRYFMSIPEAVSLVLEAGAMAEDDGATYILDMGEPVRILDLVDRVVTQSGTARPRVRFTGLRPGEKLHEDLWSAGELSSATAHTRIQRTSIGTSEVGRHVAQQVAAIEGDPLTRMWAVLHSADAVRELDLTRSVDDFEAMAG